MAAPHNDAELQHDQRRPLLSDRADGNSSMSPMQKAIGQTYQSTGQLAKLLPSGTVLSFQLLAPTLAKQGHCGDLNRMMTGGLVAFCALSCFVLSFTDSFRDEEGKVRYGFATFKGLWIIDGGASLEPLAAAEYRIRFLDFAHAIVSAMIFVAIALFDQNVESCFYPIPSEDTRQLLTTLPVVIGVIGSMLFVSFPTTRHGIGFSLSQH
ncbi:protein DMP6-like [Phragmites australis]|uniref:protein DMP6-like n=1 Tax=Phragmites australis TaxID=29695 RepID=UPI002D791FBC|nr:protein DMP6-like [Phragmites australis]